MFRVCSFASVLPLSAEGELPLHFAAGHGHAEVVTALLTAGATCDYQDLCGRTALMLAARGGHLSIVENLLQSQVRMCILQRARVDLAEASGLTPSTTPTATTTTTTTLALT